MASAASPLHAGVRRSREDVEHLGREVEEVEAALEDGECRRPSARRRVIRWIWPESDEYEAREEYPAARVTAGNRYVLDQDGTE